MNWNKVKWASAVAVVALIPSVALSVKALSVHAEDEEEAAFCLRLLDQAGEHTAFSEGRKIKLFAERLSYDPNDSAVSKRGYDLADSFLTTTTDSRAISDRLSHCQSNLAELNGGYAQHSCGYASGSLAEGWSERDWAEFYEYADAVERSGKIRFVSFESF